MTEQLQLTVQKESQQNELKQKIIASMILACVGDVIGYKNGSWEFCMDGESIHADLARNFGGDPLNIIPSNKSGWRHSDDTTMHYATAEALTSNFSNLDELMAKMAKCYISCWDDMNGRAPGGTCGAGVRSLQRMKWNQIPYNKYGGGCGGSMRAMCIGLYFSGEENRDNLVAVGIESGRLTHNHPNGFFGSMVAAAFTALALEGIPAKKWGYILINDLMPRAKKYLAVSGRDLEAMGKAVEAFEAKIVEYLKLRGIEDGNSEPKFPAKYGVAERDKQYSSWSYSGWGGASGDDSVMIAYDSILGSGDNWAELIRRSMLHGGDSDSTGTIAAAWYGAMYGWKGVPKSNYTGENAVEKEDYLTQLAEAIYAKKSSTKPVNLVYAAPIGSSTATTSSAEEVDEDDLV